MSISARETECPKEQVRPMNLCADIHVSPDHFAVGRLLTDGCSRVEFMRVIPVEKTFATYLWITGTDGGAPELEAIEESDRCGSVVPICEQGDIYLYRIEWTKVPDQLFEAVRDCDMAIRRAVGTNDRWTFRLLAAERADLTAFRQCCDERTISFTLERLCTPLTPAEQARVDLTEAQQEALDVAFRDGYFDVPRQSTLEDIGEQLGISHKAASLRLRRGVKRIMETLYEDGSLRASQR